MIFLRQSTVTVINFGPCVSNTDGVTLKTGLVSALDNATTGIMISKNAGTFAVRDTGTGSAATTYDAGGQYKVTLNATDSGTLGRLRVLYQDATTLLPVWRDFHVIPAAVYDYLVAGSVTEVKADISKLLGTAWLTPGTAGTPDVNVVKVAGQGPLKTSGTGSQSIGT